MHAYYACDTDCYDMSLPNEPAPSRISTQLQRRYENTKQACSEGKSCGGCQNVTESVILCPCTTLLSESKGSCGDVSVDALISVSARYALWP